jgi:hypothetical protein
MHKVKLIEFHDQSWFPTFMRDDVTHYLQVTLNLLDLYRPITARLRRALQESNATCVLDLCSGAGGPWPRLSRHFQKKNEPPVEIWLTDKYPYTNLAGQEASRAAANHLHFYEEPVDATRIPPELRGFRTIFNSFHHFPREKARAILKDAVDKQQGIAVVELPARHVFTIVFILLIPLVVFTVVPLTSSFKWSRLVWTYLIPVIPFVLLFDGIVSCLHVYSLAQLRELTEGLGGAAYRWEIGRQKAAILPIPITYLIGHPVATLPPPTGGEFDGVTAQNTSCK